MNKKLKIALGLGFIAAGIGLYIWNKNNDTAKCGEGEVPCPNNPLVCYNDKARYKKGSHPCEQ